MKRALLSACVLALATPALGQFEGTLEMKMSSPEGVAGTMKTWVSKVGARTEMDMKAAEGRQGKSGGMKMLTIVKYSNPDVVYVVNDAAKTYSVIDSKKTRDRVPPGEEQTWTAKKLGADRVGGFACTNASLTSSSGTVMELCVTSDILGGSTFLRDLQRRSRSGGNLAKAMADAGIEGFPVRNVMKDKAGKTTMTMQLVAAKKESVPASAFEIPPGYKESSFGPAGAMMSPEQQKAMREQMKNMTPEQRRQMEQMMKGQKAD